jgi:hypothetical protein
MLRLCPAYVSHIRHVEDSFFRIIYKSFLKSESELRCDRRSVGQSPLVWSAIRGARPDLYYCQLCVCWRGAPLAKNGSVAYNCCWVSSAQLFLGPSPTGLMTTFYFLRLRLSQPGRPGPRIYIYALGTRWSSYTPRHWIPFSPPLTTHKATVGLFEPSTTRGLTS